MDARGIKTTCPYCGVGCGVIAAPSASGDVSITGDPDHPANFGRLCSKGAALGETLSLDGRLLHPSIRGQRASWEAALDLVAGKFRSAIEVHGPHSVALYVSGQILTEDYYVANKLMKGYIGTANIDTNSRLCMASSVAGHKRAFGSDTVPGVYGDLEEADLVVLVGSNLAWCHPVLYQRLLAARERRETKIVVIDPRKTASGQFADMHIALAPGSDVAVFNGLLSHISEQGALDYAYVRQHTSGFEDAIAAATGTTLAEIEKLSGVSRGMLVEFYKLFVANERVVTIYSQGVNQSTSGTDKVNAIINCHLATGRIGRPGMGPFSVTGQPNAMGGREVGGLANMLASHMELANPEHREIVQTFWNSPVIAAEPGLKAVDLFRAIGAGAIKAVWIMGTNPVVSVPEADDVRQALRACDFVVVSDVVDATDTIACADVLLPSLAWGEKSGTVTNSERRISRQRSFLPAPKEARADWWQICEVAKRLGHGGAFAFGGPDAIFREYAALSGYRNNGARDFDITACASLTTDEYDRLQPFQWPWPKGFAASERRFFSTGAFFTEDRKARFNAVKPAPPAHLPEADRPLVLNTGRIRDQWHTMTRTGKSPRLMAHMPEPLVDINPADAEDFGIRDGELAIVESDLGQVVLRVRTTSEQQRGHLFAPMHWTSDHASSARVNCLVAGNVDRYSGQPELKCTPVRIASFRPALHGFCVSIREPDTQDFSYWARARSRQGWRAEIALDCEPGDWPQFVRDTLQLAPASELLTYMDARAQKVRFAAFVDNVLSGLLFLSNSPVSVSRDWASGLVGKKFDNSGDRFRLLAGRAGNSEGNAGPLVCSCFGVGADEIALAVKHRGCTSIAMVGAATKAGTNCGSCRSEISRIILECSMLEAV